MARNLIRAAIEELERQAPLLSQAPLQEPPKRPGPRDRGLRLQRDLVEVEAPEYTADESQALLMKWTLKPVFHVLILAAPPGVGKTTIAVEMAEREAAAGRRVLYLGPRHDFFQDVLKLAKRPQWWYEWQPRQIGDEERGKRETCRYEPQMTMWLNRGYGAMDFCGNAKVCGFNYVKQHCPYHAQGREILAGRREGVPDDLPNGQPIVFGQHQHLTGHPLMDNFDLIIGDENPLSAVLRHWAIPGRHVMLPGMDRTDPFTEIVHQLSGAVDRKVKAEGPDLLALLGGAQTVAEATAEWYERIVNGDMDQDKLIAPNVRSADAVEAVPYGHLISLAWHLHREASTAAEGRAYPPRVAIEDGRLHLLLRRQIDQRIFGKKVVWLDATANQRIYEEIFYPLPIEVVAPKIKLAGRIFQVWPRANGKASLVKEGKTNGKADQLRMQVGRIIKKYGYKRPAIITFQALESFFTDDIPESGHFYAARGTNRFEGCDCLIVAGTPQPDLQSIHATARMLFQQRMEAFNLEWSDRDRVYQYVDVGGSSYAYPVSGFWHDDDLQALLWQYREAEILQAAHRVRPARYAVDVWLLTNIPIDDLPPTDLLAINDLFDAPKKVDPWRWPDVSRYAGERVQAEGFVTTADLVEQFQVSKTTADKYLDLLAQENNWRTFHPTGRGRGRPPKAAGPLPENGNKSTNV